METDNTKEQASHQGGLEDLRAANLAELILRQTAPSVGPRRRPIRDRQNIPQYSSLAPVMASGLLAPLPGDHHAQK